MKTYAVLFFVLSVALVTNAQNPKYFAENYAWGANQNGYSITYNETTNNYVIGGPILEFDAEKWDAYIAEISPFGDVVYFKHHPESYEVGIYKLIKANGGFLAGGFSNNPGARTYYMRFDGSGELLISKVVGREAYTNHATTLCPTPDGGFLMGGEIQPYDSTATAPPTHPYLIKVDAAGEVEWDTIYWDTAPPKARIFDIDPAPNENAYYLLIQNGISTSTCDIWIVKINEAGEILWDFTIDWGNGEYPRYLHLTSDGGFLISAAYRVGATTEGYVIKTDSLGNMEWTNSDYFFRFGPTGNVVELEDGSFVLSGYFLHYPPGFGSDVDGELVKLSPDGEEIWHRTFGTPENDQYFYDMAATPSGGFIMCGRDETGVGASVYVVKTNCMGLLTEPEAEFEYEAVDAFNIQFINQSQYIYPDSIDGGHYLWDFGDGSTSNGPHPQHTYPDGAEYEVTLTAVVCSDTSVYTQTVSTTPTGIKPQARAGSIAVLPNPANNTVSISTSFGDADTPLTFSLYDISGKPVRKLALGGVESRILSIHDLPEGLYYYVVVDSETVCHKGKLMVVK